MAQTSILGRIGQLVRANINGMLDEAEDPEKMLDQLIRDFTNNIAEAEEAVAQTVGNLRLLEDDEREAREASAEWLSKAKAASDRAEALRAQGNTAEADRFDGLAKLALRRQIQFEEQVRTFDRQIEQQTELTDKLKDGLNKLRVKREELVQKRDELVSRAKMAQAQMQVQQTLKEVSVLDPTSELNRFEERIRRQEAQARGMEEVSMSSLEDQFAELESGEDGARGRGTPRGAQGPRQRRSRARVGRRRLTTNPADHRRGVARAAPRPDSGRVPYWAVAIQTGSPRVTPMPGRRARLVADHRHPVPRVHEHPVLAGSDVAVGDDPARPDRGGGRRHLDHRPDVEAGAVEVGRPRAEADVAEPVDVDDRRRGSAPGCSRRPRARARLSTDGSTGRAQLLERHPGRDVGGRGREQVPPVEHGRDLRGPDRRRRRSRRPS